MSDDFDRIVSGMNWIGPLCAFIQDIANDGCHLAVTSDVNGGPTRRALKKILSKHGITAWGLLYSPDLTMLMFSVEKRQARAACKVLDDAKIPVLLRPR